jgi:hypothetical protein
MHFGIVVIKKPTRPIRFDKAREIALLFFGSVLGWRKFLMSVSMARAVKFLIAY